jgi:hypothetical protein
MSDKSKCEHGYTEPDSYCPECPYPKAKFVIQRPEYPDWFCGWSEHGGGACWTSNSDDAVYVYLDDLVATLTKLQKHKPIAALLLLNDHKPKRVTASPNVKS